MSAQFIQSQSGCQNPKLWTPHEEIWEMQQEQDTGEFRRTKKVWDVSYMQSGRPVA